MHIYRYIDILRVFLVLRGRLGYVIHTLIFGKYISLNFNMGVLQKNLFCRFISNQDKNITSFVA